MTPSTRRVLPVVALCPLIAVAGCSSSSDTRATSSAPATSSPATPTSTAPHPSSTSTTAGVSAQAARPKAGATQSGAVAIIGDSLTYQFGDGQKAMTAELGTAGWPAAKVCWSGSDGRTVVGTLPGGAPDSVAEVARCKKQVQPRVWIIALVTNSLDDKPAALKAEVGKVLSAIGPDATVVWVNAGRRDTGESRVALPANDTLKEVVASRPKTHLADWHAFLTKQHDQAGWWRDDGTHMTPKGYAVRNAFIAAQAQQAAAA